MLALNVHGFCLNWQVAFLCMVYVLGMLLMFFRTGQLITSKPELLGCPNPY